MKLIVGLGNIGREYDNTRHNIGFNALDYILNKYNIDVDKNKFDGYYTKTIISDEQVILLKPAKYMNLSGEVVRQVMDFYKINPNDILVIHDDLDLPVGKIKLKQNSSSGGHNGIKDIEKNISTKDYKRLKIGISKTNNDIKDFVLSSFSKDERSLINDAILKSCDIIDDYLSLDFSELMNKYN